MAYFMSFLNKPINNENFSILCNLLFDELISKIPTPTLDIHAPVLIRSRPNDDMNLFSEEWQISYNSRCPEKINPGRFNSPRQPMFYACAPGETSETNDLRLTSCLESDKSILSERNTKPIQYFTSGIWHIQKPLKVINLCYNENLMIANPTMKENVNAFIKEIYNIFPSASAPFIIEFWKFICDLAAKKDEIGSEHFLSTAFSTATFAYYREVMKKELDGIVYSSPVTKNYGINIVLNPNVVDTFLSLKSVYMIKFERDKNNSKLYDIGICSKEVAVTNGKFELTIDY